MWPYRQSIADSLFPSVDPMGKPVRLEGNSTRWSASSKQIRACSSAFGVDQFACIPMRTSARPSRRLRRPFSSFTVQERADLDTVKDQAEQSLRRRRHVPYNAEDDFEVAAPNFFSDSGISSPARWCCSPALSAAWDCW